MSRKSITLILAGILLVSLFGLFLPNYIRARNTKASAACLSNLRSIDGAKGQWVLENHKKDGDGVSWNDIRPYVVFGAEGRIPKCPDGGTYILGRVGELPRCSTGGPAHSIDFDSVAKERHAERRYEFATLSLATLSVVGLLIAVFTPRKPNRSRSP
jgi:hypothetical protein